MIVKKFVWVLMVSGLLSGRPVHSQDLTTQGRATSNPGVQPAQESAPKVPVNIKAILVDKDLNQKPIAKTRFTLISTDPKTAIALDITTTFNGDAQVLVSPGEYHLVSVEPVDFQGKRFSWNVAVRAAAPATTVEISNDNASTTASPTAAPVDDAVSIFKQYRDSVVTVEAEYGPASGTGFIIDPAGIVVTNQHVITESEFVAVKFDATHRLRATVLASDAEKDCAVLWVNLSRAPQVPAIPPLLHKGDEPAVEGEKVLTIGSPLGQSKVMNTGIVSKVDRRVILSGDLSINHGNSGGPLFNSHGVVIGITQFMVDKLSGIIRIEELIPLIEEAKTKMATATKPPAELLPNEPEDTISVAALKQAAQGKFKLSDYTFTDGDYFVGITTPVYKYHLRYEFEEKAAKEKGKRTKKGEEHDEFVPLEDIRDSGEYFEDRSPMIVIQARPKVKVGGGSVLLHAYAGRPMKAHFKSDFSQMKLMCGSEEVQPLLPGKARREFYVKNAVFNINDITFDGLYFYPYDAIGPQCGKVKLELFSEKNPDKSETKELSSKSIEAIYNDFGSYREARAKSRPESTNVVAK